MTERKNGRGEITRLDIPDDLALEVSNLYVVAMDEFKAIGLVKIEEQTGDDPFEMKTTVRLEGPADAIEVFNTMWDYSHALREMGEPKDKINMGQYMRQAVMDVLDVFQLDVAANEGINIRGGDVKIKKGIAGNQTTNTTVNGDAGRQIKKGSAFIQLQSGDNLVLKKFSQATWGPGVDPDAVKPKAEDKEIKPGQRLMRREYVEDGKRMVRLVRYGIEKADAVMEDLEWIDVAQWL